MFCFLPFIFRRCVTCVSGLRRKSSSSKPFDRRRKMDAGMQIALPILGIVAAAAVTFYAVSFAELREKSFRDLEESEYEEEGRYKPYVSSRERRARRKAEKQSKS